MVTVNARFVASELTPGMRSGEYDVEEGSTVRELLDLCGSACGAPVPEKNVRFIYPLFNGRPVMLDTAITQDGTLHFCRIVTGG